MSRQTEKHRGHLRWLEGARQNAQPILEEEETGAAPSSRLQNRVGEAWKVKAEEGPSQWSINPQASWRLAFPRCAESMRKQEQLESRLPKAAHEVMNDLALPLIRGLH